MTRSTTDRYSPGEAGISSWRQATEHDWLTVRVRRWCIACGAFHRDTGRGCRLI
jgi:hypothetical protein